MPQKDLHTIIRIHKFELDEKQRKLGELMRFEQALINRRDLLIKQYNEEEQIANNDPAAAMTFGAYVDWYVKQRESVEKAIEEVGRQILAVRDEILEAYRELKTYEISQENRDAREKFELEKKMTAILDEIGLNLYRKKKAEEA